MYITCVEHGSTCILPLLNMCIICGSGLHPAPTTGGAGATPMGEIMPMVGVSSELGVFGFGGSTEDLMDSSKGMGRPGSRR